MAQSPAQRRPILWHVNADTTWVLSLPRPTDTEGTSRCYFNIVIDPWLKGIHIDGVSWISTRWHSIPSSVQTMQELNAVLRKQEIYEVQKIEKEFPEELADNDSRCHIDAVVISHEFTDHCHKETLLEVDQAVPCFATTKAASLIRSWKHFTNVVNIPRFGKEADWKATSIPPLPAWLGVARLLTDSDALYFHSAVAIFYHNPDSDGPAEVVLYSPHGFDTGEASLIANANPPLQTLALMAGLNAVSTRWNQFNLGGPNAIKCLSILGAKYWLRTHDEEHHAKGLMSLLLRKKEYTEQDIRRDMERNGDDASSLKYIELGNGEKFTLAGA